MAWRALPVSFSVVGSGPEHLGAPPTFKDPAPLCRLSVVTPALLCPRVTLLLDATFNGIHSKAQQSASQTPARLLSHLHPLQPPQLAAFYVWKDPQKAVRSPRSILSLSCLFVRYTNAG